jgi:hypothetical protein
MVVDTFSGDTLDLVLELILTEMMTLLSIQLN